VLDEGLAFWLGGSRGKRWPTLLRDLAGALRADPSLTLEQLVISRPPTDSLRSTAAGALLQLAHERGGMKALKAVLSPPRTPAGRDILRSAEQVLGVTRPQLERGWRDLVLRSAR
jgi:hypothetical protein